VCSLALRGERDFAEHAHNRHSGCAVQTNRFMA
jgi:hypothetical protein